MPTEYWIALLIIAYGVSLVYRGRRSGLKARVYNGLAVVAVGASLFARTIPWLQTTLLVAGIALFFRSMQILRQTWREMQEQQRRNQEQ